jgi:hypothetical protein
MADSKYSKHIPHLLNMHNSVILYNEVIETITNLYNDVNSKKISFLNQTEITENYYKLQERVPLDSLGTLTYNNVGNYEGFNNINVLSVIRDPEEVLDYIEDYYGYILTNLKNIRLDVTKDLNTYQRSNRVYFNFNHDDLISMNNNNLFKYFFQFEPYSVLEDSEQSILSSFFLYQIVQPIYTNILKKVSTSYQYECYTTSDVGDINIEDDELNIISDDVYSEFDDYVTNDLENISEKFAEYIINDIFILTTPSEPFTEDLNLLLQNTILKIKDLFREFNYIGESFQQKISFNAMNTFVNHIASQDVFNREYYITISQEDGLIFDENYINDKLSELISTKQNANLVSLEFISYQFKDYPLYYLNSKPIIYNNYLNDILQDPDFIASTTDFFSINEGDSEHIPNIDNWLTSINISVPDMITHLASIDIQTEFIESKALEYNFNKFFIEVFLAFFESDLFQELLVVDLINNLKEISDYVPEYRNLIINNVGRIKSYFKVFIITEIIEGNLFNGLFSEFQNAFNEVDDEFNVTNIEAIVNSFDNPTDGTKKIYLKYARGILYSSSIATVLNNILDDYRM